MLNFALSSRIQAIAAACCVAIGLGYSTSATAQSPKGSPADLGKSGFIYSGDERYLPPSISASSIADDGKYFPTPARHAGFASSTDANPAKTGRPAQPASAFASDAGPAYYNLPAMNDAVTYSTDQRDAGPARRWSVYGVDPRYAPLQPPAAFASLPTEAFTGQPGDGYTHPAYVPDYMRESAETSVTVNDDGIANDPSVHDSTRRIGCDSDWGQSPLPVSSCGPWKPPGINKPWPEDEYLFDGGDSDGEVKVRPDGSLEGLDAEDTIAHYDTLDGRTVVKPACRVCLYAPRFAVVRQVALPYGDAQLVKVGGVDIPIGPVPQLDVQPVVSAFQPVHPVGEIGQKGPITFLEHTPPIGLIANTVVRATVDRLKPYENLDLIRDGLLIEAEKPFIAQVVEAALVWTTEQGVQVVIDGKKAVAIEGDKRAQATYSITPPDHPCIRVCKVASAHSAKPGEIVEFTIRFDNVGDQTVGNVTIVDNLTTRLELVPGSGQASRKAQFFSEPNKQGSLILHWEIDEPLKPGEGGIARFKCVVR